MAIPVSSDFAARYQAGDEPLQQEDPQFPMPWIECPQVALVTSVRSGNSYTGVLFIRSRTYLEHHMSGGTLRSYPHPYELESVYKDNLMLGLIGFSGNMHKDMQEQGVGRIIFDRWSYFLTMKTSF